MVIGSVLACVLLLNVQLGGGIARLETGQGQPAPKAGKPVVKDYTRLVRLFDRIPQPEPANNPYLAARPPGSRLILSSNTSVTADLAALHKTGIDLFVTRQDALSTPEVSDNRWNWARPSVERDAAKQASAAWGLTVHAAFPPPWQRAQYKTDSLVSLEDQQTVPGLSPWSPNLRPFAERVWKATASHFGFIPVAVVGVHGQFGDAGLLTGLSDLSDELRMQWTNSIGTQANHVGFWCGDTNAQHTFAQVMAGKYGDVKGLNTAWGTAYENADTIAFPTDEASSPRAKLDFVSWYRTGVTGMADAYMDAARSACANSLLLLPVGPPDLNPKIGTDISALAEAASKRGVTLLVTNGGYHSFARNHAMTLGRARAAARWYRTPLWLQSAAPSDEDGFNQRLAEALDLGAVGFYDWVENWQSYDAVAERLSRFLTVGVPRTDVAVLFPTSSQALRPDQPAPPMYLQGATQLRDYADFDVLDERLIDAGALSSYRVAVLFEGSIWEEKTLKGIEAWLKAGGVLAAYDFGKLTTPEGNADIFGRMFPQAGTSTSAQLRESYSGKVPDVYDIAFQSNKTDWLLEGDWFMPEVPPDGPALRYTGAAATIKLPMTPGETYSVTIRSWVPDQAAGLSRKVSFEGRLIGVLSKGGDSVVRFVIPSVWVKNSIGRLTIDSETWRMNDFSPASGDVRELGVGVRALTLRRADSPGQPEPLTGRLVSSIDAKLIRDEWTAKVGLGLSAFFPSTKARMEDFLKVVRQLIYHLSEVDPERKDAPLVDDRWDGVYTSLLSDKLVFYNSSANDATVPIKLGAPRTVNVPAHTTVAVPAGDTVLDLLLQCEKFTDVGTAHLISRPDCSPGSDVTAAVVPADAAITTHIEVAQTGEYVLFVRCLRGESLVVPQIKLDGQPIPTASAASQGDVVRVGTLAIGTGVHTISMSDTAPFTADFIILSNAPQLIGFRFGTK